MEVVILSDNGFLDLRPRLPYPNDAGEVKTKQVLPFDQASIPHQFFDNQMSREVGIPNGTELAGTVEFRCQALGLQSILIRSRKVVPQTSATGVPNRSYLVGRTLTTHLAQCK